MLISNGDDVIVMEQKKSHHEVNIFQHTKANMQQNNSAIKVIPVNEIMPNTKFHLMNPECFTDKKHLNT